MKGLFFPLALVLFALAKGYSANNYPIVGIVTQDKEIGWPSDLGSTYIAASYVKYVEMSGARVVPIFYNNSVEYLEERKKSFLSETVSQ